MNLTAGDWPIVISVISLVFNLAMVTIQSRIKSDLSDLKAHIYEHFVTKTDLRDAVRSFKP